MAKRFISLAIDHGTTNSCIAAMTAHGPKVIPVEGTNPILPSAVFYDKKGGLRTGAAARNAILTSTKNEGQGYTGYKLKIGGDTVYDFAAAGKKLTAPEMGAIIIGNLLRAYSSELTTACVITIPAKFPQNSVEGTRLAAEKAGLRFFPLIMEPVAAAMCYGFTAVQQRAFWMVFDLGGGTLDVSLVISRKGKLIVPEGGHAGDDRLGGSLFDRLLADYVLAQLEQTYKLDSFRKLSKESIEWGRLLLAVEEAKINLSILDESTVKLEAPLCKDDRNKDIEVNVPITRKIYEDLIRPSTERSVQICLSLLKNMRMKSGDVERLILIGGPSKTPLIYNMLKDRLGIQLESTIDPMTAVAEGAAIYADGMEIPGSSQVQTVSQEKYQIQMDCARQSALPTYHVGGMVDGPNLENLQVQVERLDGLWKSPLVEVDAAGVFMVELTLIEDAKPRLSEFRTVLISKFGRELCHIDEPQIWYPSLAVENRLANSLRVAVKGNQTVMLINRGTALPTSGRGEFLTTKPLKKGSKEDVLRVPILESVANLLGKESVVAVGCLHVGELRIAGSDKGVVMDVPTGAEIDVELQVDESRQITAKAYIPLLDCDFAAVFSGEAFQYDFKDLKERFEQAINSLKEITEFNVGRPDRDVGEVLDIIERTGLIKSQQDDFRRAESGEKDSEMRAYKRLLELEGTLLDLRRLQRRDRVDEIIKSLHKVAHNCDQVTLSSIEKDFAQAKTDEEFVACQEAADILEYTILWRPFFDLQNDLKALIGEQATAQQIAIYKKAEAVYNRINGLGDIKNVSDTDVAEMVQQHLALSDAFTNLYKLREQKIDQDGKNPSRERTDIENRGGKNK